MDLRKCKFRKDHSGKRRENNGTYVAMPYTILQFLFGGYSCGLRSEGTSNLQIIFCPQLDQPKKKLCIHHSIFQGRKVTSQ